MKNKETVKGYKGFNPDLTCRDFRYEVGKEYDTKKTVGCQTGFHFCENPFGVFNYYAPSSEKGINRFCEVEGSGEFDKSETDKVACTHIKVNAEIGLQGLITAGIKFILDKVNWKDDKESNTGNWSAATNIGNWSAATNTGDQSAATNTGDWSASTNTGYQSAATNTGDWSASTNTGYQSAATNTGYRSVATNTGDQSTVTNTGNQSAATNTGNWSAATNTGNWSAATNTGNQSAATNTGNQSAATNTGYRSAATNTGDQSAATNAGDQSAAINTGERSVASVEGKDSIAIVTGKDSKAKGTLGCWIVLTEREDWSGESYPIKEVKAFRVDGETIKADTYYKLVNGEAVEVE